MSGLPHRARPSATAGMHWVPGGTFVMGSDVHYPEEAPAHRVTVDGFWMDTCAVTNKQFGEFVRSTGYVTVAERSPDPADYPDADPDLLAPSSSVFVKPQHRVDLSTPYNWWTYIAGAQWRHPQGPGSSIHKLGDHPVVHVAWQDVDAYAHWVGKDLPTEAEWEFAARGGLDGAPYAWREEFTPGGRWMANTWQGEFPIQNTGDDGYEGTAPVGSYPANGYGLRDMIGNVWEWTTDWYGPHQIAAHSCCAVENPRGGRRERSLDPALKGISIPRRVMKGGSHLCARTTASGTARRPGCPNTSTPRPHTWDSAASTGRPNHWGPAHPIGRTQTAPRRRDDFDPDRHDIHPTSKGGPNTYSASTLARRERSCRGRAASYRFGHAAQPTDDTTTFCCFRH